METTVPSSRFSSIRQVLALPGVGPFIALLLASLFFTTQTSRFLTVNNWLVILNQVGWVAVLAIGQTLIILTGGIDISNGAIMTLGAVIMVNITASSGVDPFLAIGVGIAVTVAFGVINGLLVTKLRLPPFIVTLGMLSIAYAITLIYTTATTVAVAQQTFLGETIKKGTPLTYGTVLMFVLYFLVWAMLRETAFGRHIYAIGNNKEAVRLAGVSTDRLLVAVYALAGLFYGIAALVAVGRSGTGDPYIGVANNANLESITAVVLGGTSLFGGRGNVLGTLIGALIIGVFRNGLQLMGVNSLYQILITGILVILAVAVDQFSQRGRAG